MKVTFFLILFTMIFGCNSKPSESVIKKYIVSYTNETYNELGLGKIAKTDKIKIVNGYSRIQDGTPGHIVFVQYDLVFLKEPKEILSELETFSKDPKKLTKNFTSFSDALNKITNGAALINSIIEMSVSGEIKKRNTLKRTVVLINGQNGWFVSSSEFGWNKSQ